MFGQDMQSMLSFFYVCLEILTFRVVHLSFHLDRLSRRGEFLSALAKLTDEARTWIGGSRVDLQVNACASPPRRHLVHI